MDQVYTIGAQLQVLSAIAQRFFVCGGGCWFRLDGGRRIVVTIQAVDAIGILGEGSELIARQIAGATQCNPLRYAFERGWPDVTEAMQVYGHSITSC